MAALDIMRDVGIDRDVRSIISLYLLPDEDGVKSYFESVMCELHMQVGNCLQERWSPSTVRTYTRYGFQKNNVNPELNYRRIKFYKEFYKVNFYEHPPRVRERAKIKMF